MSEAVTSAVRRGGLDRWRTSADSPPGRALTLAGAADEGRVLGAGVAA